MHRRSAAPGSSLWAPSAAVFRPFAADLRRERGRLIGGMAFGVVYALARVVEPWPLKVVFDQVLFHKPAHGGWFRLFTAFGHSNYDILAAAGVLLVGAGLVRGVAYFYEDLLLSTAAQQIVYKIHARAPQLGHRRPA